MNNKWLSSVMAAAIYIELDNFVYGRPTRDVCRATAQTRPIALNTYYYYHCHYHVPVETRLEVHDNDACPKVTYTDIAINTSPCFTPPPQTTQKFSYFEKKERIFINRSQKPIHNTYYFIAHWVEMKFRSFFFGLLSLTWIGSKFWWARMLYIDVHNNYYKTFYTLKFIK